METRFRSLPHQKLVTRLDAWRRDRHTLCTSYRARSTEYVVLTVKEALDTSRGDPAERGSLEGEQDICRRPVPGELDPYGRTHTRLEHQQLPMGLENNCSVPEAATTFIKLPQ